MNAAALKANLQAEEGRHHHRQPRWFRCEEPPAGRLSDDARPLELTVLANYTVHAIDVTKMTRASLEGTTLGTKEKDRCKNMFVLGFINWMYDRGWSPRSASWNKVRPQAGDPEANRLALKAGFDFGDTSETSPHASR